MRRRIQSFWGPKMQAVIREAERIGVHWRPMSPSQFAARMDEITGVKHLPSDVPEVAAARWLEALRAH